MGILELMSLREVPPLMIICISRTIEMRMAVLDMLNTLIKILTKTKSTTTYP